MHCYSLISCDALSYPDITNLCSSGRSSLEGRVVTITGSTDGFTYTLTYIGLNLCKCVDNLPPLTAARLDTCADPIAARLKRIKNCQTGEEIDALLDISVADGVVISIVEYCGCWTVAGSITGANESITVVTQYGDCTTCIENLQQDICPQSERSLSYAVKIRLPEDEPPDRGFGKCCYTNLVLADLSDSDPYKNDFTGFWFKKQTPSDTCDFKLVNTATLTEYLLNDATYGTFQDFGGVEPNLTFYIVDWRKVLNLLGEGSYQVKKEITIAGIAVTSYSDTHTLRAFSIDIADKTVRIDSVIDGSMVKQGVNFKGTGFETSVRLRGFFGRPERSYEQDNIARRDYNFVQNTMSGKTEYQFQGLQIPECISTNLFDFILFGSELYVSDYNKNNHSYRYELTPVKLEGNAGSEYFVTDRGVNINLTFSDRRENNRKINC